MLYLTVKFIMTLIFWFLIFNLFNFIFEKQKETNYGVVKFVNQLRSTQYTVFILSVLLIGFILNWFITQGDFYYKWLFIYSIVLIYLFCLNKYRDKK
ncbi:MAG TPA: hypothetical protein DD654_01375 [Leuconostoc lactis]|nr:hypothetical protein [Leuconostoc lactis]